MNRYKVCDRIVVGVCSMSENLAVAYCSSSEQQHHSSSSSSSRLVILRCVVCGVSELARDLQHSRLLPGPGPVNLPH